MRRIVFSLLLLLPACTSGAEPQSARETMGRVAVRLGRTLESIEQVFPETKGNAYIQAGHLLQKVLVAASTTETTDLGPVWIQLARTKEARGAMVEALQKAGLTEAQAKIVLVALDQLVLEVVDLVEAAQA